MPERNSFGAFVVGFLVGGVAAGAAALLLAPQSGEQTRTLIKVRSIELRDQVQHTAEETIAKAEAIIDEAARKIKKQPVEEAVQPDKPVAV